MSDETLKRLGREYPYSLDQITKFKDYHKLNDEELERIIIIATKSALSLYDVHCVLRLNQHLTIN